MNNRDLGNEFIVAIATVGVIAFALAFGILLTLSSNSRPTPAATTSVANGDARLTETLDANTPVGSTPTFTGTSTPTQSITLTSEATTQTSTNRTETFTATSRVTVTSTTTDEIIPSVTNTPRINILTPTTRGVTATVVTQDASSTHKPDEAIIVTTTNNVPSATNTRRANPPTIRAASRTPAVAVTDNAPSNTGTPRTTNTLTVEESTFTPTSTRTPSAVRTPTVTSTATRTLTRTLLPSVTPTFFVTATPFMTATSGIVATPAVTETPTTCARPAGWSAYIVQPGNTLFSIALAAGSSVRELSRANCLSNADRILTGDTIFVPRPVQAGTPSTPAPGVIARLGCADASIAAISSPYVGQRVSSTFTLRGTATIPDFWYYKIEIRPDVATGYNFYAQSETAVKNGDLGRIDPSIFGNGLHWIRLAVVKKDASVPPSAVCVVPVYFD